MIINSNDARRGAKRRLPRVFFEYLDSGASSEATLNRNIRDFQNIILDQRVLVDISKRSLESHFMGRSRPAPIVLGPVGFVGAFRLDGEILAARASHKLGLPYCLSAFSVASVSALRAATDGEIWAQLYVTKDEELFDSMIERAISSSVDTICITVDTPAGGFRPRDIRSGMRGATRLTPQILMSLAAKPGW